MLLILIIFIILAVVTVTIGITSNTRSKIECQPDCKNKQCGKDGCDGSCGICKDPSYPYCNGLRLCVECLVDDQCPSGNICDLSGNCQMKSLILATGSGNSSIAYSYDGLAWISVDNSNNKLFTQSGESITWNHRDTYVAVGAGKNSIAYSHDLVNWTGLRYSTLENPFYFSYSVTWIESLGIFLAGGIRSSLPIGHRGIVARSHDGINWDSSSNISQFFDQVYGVASNDHIIVAGGVVANASIAYSYDAINWSPVDTSADPILGWCSKIFWTGKFFLAGGGIKNGIMHSIAYSVDGMNWQGVMDSNTIFTVCTGFATNDSIIVAIGKGNCTLAYSDDGRGWTPVDSSNNFIFPQEGNTVVWNGHYFIAGSKNSSVNPVIAYSENGINWTKEPIDNEPLTGIVTLYWNHSEFR